MQSVQEKYKNLQEYLKSLGSVAVAFSSGVDSTFLLAAAKETIGADHVIAVTASSCSFPKRELEEAKQFCKEQGIRHIVCKSEELDIEGFRQNPKNRCYLCKHELFEKILEIAKEYHINAVAEGSNMDDNGDYRPGLVAVAELGIKSPLREALLNKEEIRTLSKEMGLQPGTSSHLHAFPPGLSMGRQFPKKNSAWWIGRSSFCWIWAFIRCA